MELAKGKVKDISGKQLLLDLLERVRKEVEQGEIIGLALAIERPVSTVTHVYAQMRNSDAIRLLGAVVRLQHAIQLDLDEYSGRWYGTNPNS